MNTITASLVAGTSVEITNGRQTWTADEPLGDGGTDLGPNPYELMLGALASCTLITLVYFARRHDIALDSIAASFTYDRIHAEDCLTCVEGTSGWLNHVDSHLELTGGFTDEQRARLTAIAKNCPVHRTLQEGIHIDDTIAFS
jgi:putative redox protein